jgi:hypothetical protein
VEETTTKRLTVTCSRQGIQPVTRANGGGRALFWMPVGITALPRGVAASPAAPTPPNPVCSVARSSIMTLTDADAMW